MRRRALARGFVLAVVVAATVLGLASPARASGPTSLGVSGWQVYSNPNTYINPLWSFFGGFYFHGDPGEYGAAPAIPAENASGWADCGPNAPLRSSPYAATSSLCPNSSTIGMAVGSILTTPCFEGLNFTYFQSLVSIPSGTTISQFSVNMSGADDGARVSLVNSSYPSGITPSGGYIWSQTGQSTGNLAPYVVAGEVNRVVITQVDDCAVGNNLNSAQISLNGTVIQPDTTAPTASPSVSPAPNGNGWNNSDVTVDWNWTDTGGSGIDSSNCTTSSASSGEGTQTLSATCSDGAGNVGHASKVVKVDKTAPTLTVPDPISVETSSSSTAVSYSATATDNLDSNPGVSCSPASGSSFPLGLTTVSCTATDQAGNSSSKSFTVAVSNPVPAPGQANGVASHVSTGQEQIATASTIDTSSPDFTGQPWFTPVAAQNGAGLAGSYGRFSGTDWLSEYDQGKSINPHWSRFRASFDAPNGGMTLKLLVDNAVTGVWVNGHAVGTCARDSASQCPPHDGGYALPGLAIPIPDADLQPTGNVVVIEVLDYETGLSTGGIDFEVVPQPPTVTPQVSGTLGSNGWYTSDVSVHWNIVGADSTSAGCADTSVTTDTSGTTFTCTATNTGGSTTQSVTVKRDATTPTITASATSGGNPYTSGTWTNQDVVVHFTCSDGGSGVASVTPDQTVSGEFDGFNVTGTCTDNAGNSSSTAFFDIRIDKTAPTASPVAETSPNANGWYKNDVTVDWNWSDVGDALRCSRRHVECGSGVDPLHCTTSSTSAGRGTITLTATCTDLAGNTGTSIYNGNGDKTAPVAAPATETDPNANGWFNQDATVDWNWTDTGGSTIDASNCTTSSTSSGEGTITLSATCTDLAGNTGTADYTVQVDKTAPSISVAAFDKNGNPVDVSQWQNHDVVVHFSCSDAVSGVASVTDPQTVSSDGVSHVPGTCVDEAGNSASTSLDVKVDETPPTITASATSGGNAYTAGTWTNQDVVVHYSCSDATSGVASVDPDTTVSTEGDGQSATGTCTDVAGNSASATFDQIRIDKTAPSLDPSVSPDPVGLGFAATASPGASDSLSGVASASCDPVDTSSLGTHTVGCTATDNAGNTASATVSYDVTGMATKQAVLDAVQAAEAGAAKHDAQELDAAAKDLTKALAPTLWTDPNHPASKKVFEDEKQAVQEFDELLKDKHSAVDQASLVSWTNSLVTLDRAMAALAISDATTAGADSHQLAEAAKELAKGDDEAAKGHYNDAIEHYGNAWDKVQDALKHHTH